MARERVEMHQLQELVRLHRMGVGARAVARQLRISPTTERRYRAALESAGLLTGPADALPSEAELKARVEVSRPGEFSLFKSSRSQTWLLCPSEGIGLGVPMPSASSSARACSSQVGSNWANSPGRDTSEPSSSSRHPTPPSSIRSRSAGARSRPS